MEFRDAALTVLREEGKPLHWTVIQDRALKRGYLDPFAQTDIRKNLLRELSGAVADGSVRKEESTGVFSIAPG